MVDSTLQSECYFGVLTWKQPWRIRQWHNRYRLLRNKDRSHVNTNSSYIWCRDKVTQYTFGFLFYYFCHLLICNTDIGTSVFMGFWRPPLWLKFLGVPFTYNHIFFSLDWYLELSSCFHRRIAQPASQVRKAKRPKRLK